MLLTDMNGTLGKLSDHALEMIMRDVLDGLAELANQAVLEAQTGQCQVLSIEASQYTLANNEHTGHCADIVDFSHYKKAVGS